ncbi:Agamous-like MADS-box protein [Sesamum alatum]|uniref:Agamous-like MADS-box protein n=1 Tax=Sesamum alatum TaxID=300844 RepID=A0AAE2CF71_9LAMI|nr:Agamous-like MADS-box protein [Sesamum alatum]
MAKKPSMGRQKIKIEKIEVKNHLQVTFSKRRSGLFKKASELCTFCGVEIAIIVFSPAGKVLSFGHPNVESIIDRFLARISTGSNSHDPFHLIEAQRNASVRELNLQLGLEELEQLRDAMEELKKNVTQHGNKLMNPSSMFVSNGAGVFDQYESKPSHGIVGSSNMNVAVNVNSNFGYCHRFF